jgi:hypothetical protein
MMLAGTSQIQHEGAAAGLFHFTDPERDAKVFLYSLVGFFPNALSEPPVAPLEADLLDVINWFLETWKANVRQAKPKKSASRPKRRAKARKT